MLNTTFKVLDNYKMLSYFKTKKTVAIDLFSCPQTSDELVREF